MKLLNNYWCCFSTVLVICTVVSIFTVEVKSEKILFLLPISTKSHKNIFDPFIKGLAKNGHEIFVMSSLKSSGMPKNVEEFVPVPLENLFGSMENVFETRNKSALGRILINTDFLTNACNKIFEHPKTMEILKTKQNYYDLIVMDAMGNNCIYGMVPILGAPVLSVATFPPTNQMAENYGCHLPSSFVPSPLLPFSHHMSFSKRLINTIFNWFIPFMTDYMYMNKMQAVYRKHLGEDLPGSHEIESTFSVLLTNSHFSMNYPRPSTPDIIEIGGIHCGPPKPLPTDLEDFVAGATHGFIYFSLGSIIKSKEMPEEYRKAFINAFASLKQRVLWKWDNDDMEDLPENVKLIKWAPQQDILGHKNIKLFISHGGLLSTQEAVYHGVPVLNIPFFADQDLNSNANFEAGYALTVEIIGITEEILSNNIKQLLENPKFSMRAKELSSIFRYQKETPLERAVYWAEYVMKFKGAPHLRSASRDLSWFQYHSLDVIAFLLFSTLATLWVIVICTRKLAKKCLNVFTSSKRSDLSLKKDN